MATTHDIRRLAFQAIYQLDARPGEASAEILESMATDNDEANSSDATAFTVAERRRAFNLASKAFDNRAAADEFMVQTAPTWPTHRQAAVDRAILRLAHYEMTTAQAPPKVVVNEAVELAKAYSTDKSASFVNGVLDKLLKLVEGEKPEGPATDVTPAVSPSTPVLAPVVPATGEGVGAPTTIPTKGEG
jgi:N utilization substance protein B